MTLVGRSSPSPASKEIVPAGIDALTFEQECDTALENASKLSE
jgi:hypothetical protein